MYRVDLSLLAIHYAKFHLHGIFVKSTLLFLQVCLIL